MKFPKAVGVIWLAIVVAAGYPATRLQERLQGGTDPPQDCPADQVAQFIDRGFGSGSSSSFVIVLESDEARVGDPAFAQVGVSLRRALAADPAVLRVAGYTPDGPPGFTGRSGKSALFLVSPNAVSFVAAEALTERIRLAARAHVPRGFDVTVGGMTAMYYDLNQNSARDLLDAERIGIPLTLVVLLAIFGSPVAACLPLAIAILSMIVSLAGLYFLSFRLPVSVFAQNTVSMIGMGVGVDYALFLVSRYRDELARGCTPVDAAIVATDRMGPAIIFSGATVAVGFLMLFLVNASFLHSLAIGGVLVVACALVATCTLLPVALSVLGQRVARSWGTRNPRAPSSALWTVVASAAMRRPWLSLIPALAVLTVFVVPVFRIASWNIGAMDLAPHMEARRCAGILEKEFSAGWMGPVIVTFEAPAGQTVWSAACRERVATLAGRWSSDAEVSRVDGFPTLLAGLGPMASGVHRRADLPGPLQAAASGIVSDDDRLALAILVPRSAPEKPAAMSLVQRVIVAEGAPVPAGAVVCRVGGASAMLADFDAEFFGSLWRVVPAVLGLTFLVLLIVFRSLVIPLKAIVLNLASVLGAYGFLVYVFQDGIGASWLGFTPPGGLNSFIVLMVFTILFGLSMDYEIFLLSRIREEYLRTRNNAESVSAGIEQTGGLITSAALIMIVLFGSFGFTQLVATREFGLGLAFAVALDATLIRAVLVPVLMRLMGDWNWWLPFVGGPRRASRR